MMNKRIVLNSSISPEDAVKKIQEDVIKLRSGSITGETGSADTSLNSES